MSNLKGSSWTQKELFKHPIPEREEILLIASSTEDLRDRTLFILCYLLAGRMSEVLDLKKNNFTFDDTYDREIILIKNMPNRKNRIRKFKDLPIPIDNDFEQEMMKLAWEYIIGLEDTERLFKLKERAARHMMNKKFKINAHYLRH